MVKTRANKKSNQLFEKDFVQSSSGKVSKKQKRKPTILSSPRSKRGTSPATSSDNTTPDSSPSKKKVKRSSDEGSSGDTRRRALTIVLARKRPLFGSDESQHHHHHVKRSKSKKHKLRIKLEDDDPRSTSASFKRKGMDRVSRPDSPTRGMDEVDRIRVAIEEVKSGAVSSVQKAAFKWRVHADKLYRRLKGTVRIDGRNGPPPVLSRAEEDKLTTWIITMSERGFPVSSASLRNTVQNFLKQDKRQNPFTDDKPSMSWYKAFVRRNPRVKKVTSMMLVRSHKSMEAILRGWFNELDTFLRCLDIIDKPERIWYFTAIDLYTDKLPAKALSPYWQPTNSEDFSSREKVCTCIVSANAAGHVIPPFFVFRGLCVPSSWDPLVGAPLSSGLLFSQMGSTSKVLYSDWLENHFLPNIGPNRPTALLLDCPEGHVDVDVFVTAQQNDVHMFRILPAIADMVCPVPEEMLKGPWETESALWNTSHPLVPVSVKNTARIVGKAWPKLDQPGIITQNFRKAGIYPVDSRVSASLVKGKSRRKREAEDAQSVASIRPPQTIIDLELFESNLDRPVKEEYHRRLLSKDTSDETEHFREWKHLYEAVYGNIIPVHDVPVAEEEVTVSYEEHVMGDSEVNGTQFHQGQPVTVEIKEDDSSSRIVLSSDLSSVPRDVINVALTMATDIATFRTESGSTRQHETAPPTTTEPVVAQSTDDTMVTAVAVTAVASEAGSSPMVVVDGGEVTTTAEASTGEAVPPVLSVAECSVVEKMPKPWLSTAPTPENIQKRGSSSSTVVNVVPVASKSGPSPTVVKIIRVTPGERRDVVKSNIAVKMTPVTTRKVGRSVVTSSVIRPISKAAAIPSPEPEESLPLIHISDSGEVSVVPQTRESEGEVVEVTDVVEVDSHSFRGLSADQVLQQIQVSEMEVVSEPGGNVSSGVVAETEVVHPDIMVMEETAMEVDVISDPVAESSATGVATSSGDSAGPGATGSKSPGSGTTKENTILETLKQKTFPEEKATVVSQSSETAGFVGPGDDVPLMQDDVINETEVATQSSVVVVTSDVVNSAGVGQVVEKVPGKEQGPAAISPMLGDVAMKTVKASSPKKSVTKKVPGIIPMEQSAVVIKPISAMNSDCQKGGILGILGRTGVSTKVQIEGPGDVPLLEKDVVSETDNNPAPTDLANQAADKTLEQSEKSQAAEDGTGTITVNNVVSLGGVASEALNFPAGTVEVIQRSLSNQDEMGEILAPSAEEETSKGATGK